jgi:hypothetical protein
MIELGEKLLHQLGIIEQSAEYQSQAAVGAVEDGFSLVITEAGIQCYERNPEYPDG